MSDGEEPSFEMILEIRNAGDQAFLKSLLEAEGIVYFMLISTMPCPCG